MQDLLRNLSDLKKTKLRNVVDARLQEFKESGKLCNDDLFSEMSFCMLTANYNAERAISIQRDVGDGFLRLPEEKLAARLKELGYRYPNLRAKFIVESRKHKNGLSSTLSSARSQQELREWIVKNVKGLGYKEASHFLRNIGFDDLAIIDFHIMDILECHGIVKRPKTMTPKRYLEMESVLRKLATTAGMSLAELDLYLWWMETGKVLK